MDGEAYRFNGDMINLTVRVKCYRLYSINHKLCCLGYVGRGEYRSIGGHDLTVYKDGMIGFVYLVTSVVYTMYAYMKYSATASKGASIQSFAMQKKIKHYFYLMSLRIDEGKHLFPDLLK